MSTQDWLLIISAIGTAFTMSMSALIPLLIRELRRNTIATQGSTQATQVRNIQHMADNPGTDPLAVIAAIQQMAAEVTTPKPVG